MRTSLNFIERCNCWKVTPTKDASSFFRELAELLPSDSVLYIESGGSPPDDIEAFLRAEHVDDDLVIPGGTLLPKPRIYKLSATKAHLDVLAKLGKAHPTPVGSIHLHVYRGKDVLLLSYDTFLDPFHISKEIPEIKVKAFCERLGLQYEDPSAGSSAGSDRIKQPL